LGIEHLTLYTFSVENWRRSEEEVRALMGLIEFVARREIHDLHRRNVRLQILGRLGELPSSLRAELDRDIAMTRNNTGLNLNLAINYGGRAEIVDAVRRVADLVARGALRPDEITEETLAAKLYDPGLPDPDLVIRTGGEMRLSNFLLWQAAYSELWVTQTLWPDFGHHHLDEALGAYRSRERRFGAVLTPAAAA
jgi:undecaprenyl diphosphate synthase